MVVVHLSDNTTLDGTGDVLDVHEIALETEFMATNVAKWSSQNKGWRIENEATGVQTVNPY